MCSPSHKHSISYQLIFKCMYIIELIEYNIEYNIDNKYNNNDTTTHAVSYSSEWYNIYITKMTLTYFPQYTSYNKYLLYILHHLLDELLIHYQHHLIIYSCDICIHRLSNISYILTLFY